MKNELLVSKDGRYIYGFDRIIDLERNIYTDIDSPNPIFVCEMFKNEAIYNYKHSLIESRELFSNIRKSIYHLLESDSSLIMEYEIKFGQNLILEVFGGKNLIKNIEESWDFVKNKIILKYPGIIQEGWFGDAVDWVKDKASSVGGAIKSVASKAWDATKSVASSAWEGIKKAGAWVISKGIPWVMTKIEEFMLSPVGIGLDVGLSLLGIGKIATGVVWGILLVWKVYKLVSGKSDANDVWTYIDIAVCLAGIVFSGAAKGLKSAFKSAGGNVAKVSGKVLQPVLTVLSKGLGGIMNLMIKPLEWIAKLFGSKASGMISSFKSKLGDILKKMETIFKPKSVATASTQTTKTGFKQGVQNYIKKDFTEPISKITKKDLGTATRKGLSWGSGVYVGTKGLEKGAKALASNTEPSQEDLAKIAQSIPDETLKQGVESDMTDLLNKMN